jgi:hypothetical protein
MATPKAAVYTLTSEFREKATPERKAQRRATREATKKRNEDNRKALGNWHNASRGKMSEIPMPARRTH